VTGIGKKTIERNKDKIVLQEPKAETATEPPSTEERNKSQAQDETPTADDSAKTP